MGPEPGDRGELWHRGHGRGRGGAQAWRGPPGGGGGRRAWGSLAPRPGAQQSTLGPHQGCWDTPKPSLPVPTRPSSPSTRTRSADCRSRVRDASEGTGVRWRLRPCPCPSVPTCQALEREAQDQGSFRLLQPPSSSGLPAVTRPPRPDCAKGWPGPGLCAPSPCFALNPWGLAWPLSLPSSANPSLQWPGQAGFSLADPDATATGPGLGLFTYLFCFKKGLPCPAAWQEGGHPWEAVDMAGAALAAGRVAVMDKLALLVRRGARPLPAPQLPLLSRPAWPLPVPSWELDCAERTDVCFQ